MAPAQPPAQQGPPRPYAGRQGKGHRLDRQAGIGALDEQAAGHRRALPGRLDVDRRIVERDQRERDRLDELLELMAQRMAAMQAMLNSMTPEQRAQLQQLSDQLMEDMDLQWQMQQLSGNLQQMFPQLNWNKSYDFEGQDPMGFQQAMQAMQDTISQLRMSGHTPGVIVEIPRNACSFFEFWRAEELIKLGWERTEQAFAHIEPRD
jgi:uncharacterized protein with von Willebrand factor type A (vWA) domain